MKKHRLFPKQYLLYVASFSLMLLQFAFAQDRQREIGRISGSFQTDAQLYFEDSVINAPDVDESLLSNSYLQLLYQRDNFTAGVRFEAYLNPLLGFDPRYSGIGIPYRFAQYSTHGFEITVGNFYEQFGNGLIFRSYQEWALGVDNSVDGVRVKYSPKAGIYLTGLIGKQRYYWDRSEGIVRGGDIEISLNSILPPLKDSKVKISIGGSAMSKYQADQDPVFVLPENVTAFAGRASIRKGRLSIKGEYAYKINDPSSANRFNYNEGSAIYLNANYSKKGFGISASAKRINNMDFRSDRTASINDLTLSFLPAISYPHTYRLPTLYPYATQPNGEIGGQVDVFFKIPKGSTLGGKYGTKIRLNYSRIQKLDTTHIIADRTYEINGFGAQDSLYFQDFNLEIYRKFSKNFKATLTYIFLKYNKDVVEFGGSNAGFGTVDAHVVVLEGSNRLSKKHNLRWELQHMQVNKDLGSWAMALIEYSISPHWYFSVFDEYNYGNDDPDRRVHYYSVSAAYVKGANRVSFGYAKQRAGLLCVGGICRVVPASNGLTLSLTSSF